MLLSDVDYIQLCSSDVNEPLIDPFIDHKISDGFSYGVSECGYDVRLSSNEFKVIDYHNWINSGLSRTYLFDPKFDMDQCQFKYTELMYSDTDQYFILPSLSYGLGVTHEKVNLTPDLSGLLIGKSTYARSALMLNTTPIDAGFLGHIVVEMFNPLPCSIKVYANEGIGKLMLWKHNDCSNPYNGKYQDQKECVTHSIVNLI